GVAEGGGNAAPGPDAGGRAIKTPSDPPRQEHRAERRDRRPEPRRPLRGAEELEGQGGEPEVERRLLEIRQTVAVGNESVSGGHHLARDRRGEALGRVEQ